MRGLIFNLLVIVLAGECIANRPKWTYSTPESVGSAYYYKSERALGKTEEEATNKAFAKILQSASNTLGVAYDSKMINDAVMSGGKVSVESQANNLPVSKVCEYSEYIGDGYQSFVLAQIARSANVSANFETFTRCNETSFDFVPMVKSAVVPGWGQFSNGYQKKGGIFFFGEALLVVSAVFSDNQAANYLEKSNRSFQSQTREYYYGKSNDWKMIRNATGAGVLVVWALNLIDAATLSNVPKDALVKSYGFDVIHSENRVGVQISFRK